MANAVITVLESDGTTETDVTVLDVGRQAAAASKSLTLATEDKSVLDDIKAGADVLAAVDTSAPLPVQIRSSGGTEASILTTVAHDAVDAGDPLKVGMRALAHGTNPTAVAAADRTDWLANRAGVPWVIGGHPNVITRSATIDDGDGAQTDASLLTVGAGAKIVVTMISATCSASNSGAVAFRIGFGTATLAAASETGTAGILLEGKFNAGGGHQRGNGSGIVGIGADNEDLRITCDDPAGGSLFVTFSYYTIES